MAVPLRREAAIILNPASGKAGARDRARRALYELAQRGARVSLHETAGPGDARKLAARLALEVEVLLSFGGDGTLNETLNGVVDAGAATPIAVFPTGTANVVSRELALPEGDAELAEIALNGAVRALDLGLARRPGEERGRRFAMCAGAGLDAAVVEVVSRERTAAGISMLDYYIPTVAALLKYDFPPMRVSVDGRVVDEKSTFTLVGNMRRYGGPFQFFNKATPDDGRLDVCCLHGRNQLDLLRYGLGTMQKNLPDYRGVHYYQGSSILIESQQEVLVQIDGDCGGRLPMRFDVLPAAVNFCVGPA